MALQVRVIFNFSELTFRKQSTVQSRLGPGTAGLNPPLISALIPDLVNVPYYAHTLCEWRQQCLVERVDMKMCLSQFGLSRCWLAFCLSVLFCFLFWALGAHCHCCIVAFPKLKRNIYPKQQNEIVAHFPQYRRGQSNGLFTKSQHVSLELSCLFLALPFQFSTKSLQSLHELVLRLSCQTLLKSSPPPCKYLLCSASV